MRVGRRRLQWDGFEDSLVEVNWHYREGTGLGNEILLVQRVEPKPLTVPATPAPSRPGSDLPLAV
jgi:hypothetical protein